MPKPFKLAMIGLDTSHSIQFAKRIQGDAPKKVRGMRITRCLRFESPFQTEAQQDERQVILEGWGIEVTRDFNHAVDGVDGILLEINDPAQHLTWFKACADLKLPLFLDKPMAKDLRHAKRIQAIAKQKKIRVFESSSMRLIPQLIAAKKKIKKPSVVNIYGALGQAFAGSSLVWYGCHTFQMLQEIINDKPLTVHAVETPRGIVTTFYYKGDRQGVVECTREDWHYGGRIQGDNTVTHFEFSGDSYDFFMTVLRNFFIKGMVPVPLKHSVQVQAMLQAAERSLKQGKSVKYMD